MPRPHYLRRRSAARRVFALFGATCLWACAETQPLRDTPDASTGPLCEPGTQACVCSSSGACDEGLLCNAGRCLSVQGGQDPEDPVSPGPRPPAGSLPPAPPSIGDAGSDAADASPDAADASQPPTDAAAPADAASP